MSALHVHFQDPLERDNERNVGTPHVIATSAPRTKRSAPRASQHCPNRVSVSTVCTVPDSGQERIESPITRLICTIRTASKPIKATNQLDHQAAPSGLASRPVAVADFMLAG